MNLREYLWEFFVSFPSLTYYAYVELGSQEALNNRLLDKIDSLICAVVYPLIDFLDKEEKL